MHIHTYNLIYTVKATLFYLGVKIKSPFHVELIHRMSQPKEDPGLCNYNYKGRAQIYLQNLSFTLYKICYVFNNFSQRAKGLVNHKQRF